MMLLMVIAEGLRDAERQVWDAFPTGRLVKLGTGSAEDDKPVEEEDWGPERRVRAEVLAALLCGAAEVESGKVGEVYLDGACISGKLELPGAIFKHRLRLKNCYVPDGIDLSEATTRTLELQGCRVGAVRLDDAEIGGVFDLRGTHLYGKDGPALSAESLTVTSDMRCDEEFYADGEISLMGAKIGGQLNFSGAHLNGKDRRALAARSLTVAADMLCDEGFQADGEISLMGAKIGGQLSLTGARLNGKDGRALTAQSLTVTESIFCDEGFHAEGGVSLMGAKIGGQLNLHSAHLNGKDGPALIAQDLTVTESVFCDEGFEADGEIDLTGAKIGGQLSLTGARLNGKDGPALIAQGLTVARAVFCDRGFQADGEIDLTDASIGGPLNLSSAHLNGKDGLALNALSLTVARAVFCDEGFHAEGGVSLIGAKVGELVDDRESWPPLLVLDGLDYGNLPTYMPARDRLDWLNRSVEYSPQPYEQLAAYYRRLGHDDQARHVLLAKQRQRRRQRFWWARWWGWLQDALAGYGYAPGRAMLWLVGAFVVGWLVFSSRHPVQVGPGTHPAFNAALYTLDVLIPAPAFGQASDFDPQGSGLAVAAGLHILGWLLAITVIAAITRSLSRS